MPRDPSTVTCQFGMTLSDTIGVSGDGNITRALSPETLKANLVAFAASDVLKCHNVTQPRQAKQDPQCCCLVQPATSPAGCSAEGKIAFCSSCTRSPLNRMRSSNPPASKSECVKTRSGKSATLANSSYCIRAKCFVSFAGPSIENWRDFGLSQGCISTPSQRLAGLSCLPVARRGRPKVSPADKVMPNKRASCRLK